MTKPLRPFRIAFITFGTLKIDFDAIIDAQDLDHAHSICKKRLKEYGNERKHFPATEALPKTKTL